jgi:crossover junction endodeoxyribonuclease RusA
MIILPFPPSVNHYWRRVGNRTIISKAGREYRKRVMIENPATTDPNKDDRLRVEIIAFQPDQRRRDLDNMLKAPLDALQACGAYHDDSQIDDLIIRRGYDKENPRLEAWITNIPRDL